MGLHSALTADSIHVTHAFTYANAAARTGATGLLPGDIGKIARQTDNNSFWILQNDSPVTWAEITQLASNEVVYIKDVKPNNTDGGTFTSGSLQTRVLNTLENPQAAGWVSLAANQFTLQAGTYSIEASAPARAVGENKAVLRNITDSTNSIIGTSEYADSIPSQFYSKITGTVVITSAKVYEIQHQCFVTQATDGFGQKTNLGFSEVYTVVKITKLR